MNRDRPVAAGACNGVRTAFSNQRTPDPAACSTDALCAQSTELRKSGLALALDFVLNPLAQTRGVALAPQGLVPHARKTLRSLRGGG